MRIEHRSKGAGVATWMAMLREKLTAAQLDYVERQVVNQEARALLRRRILPVEWIPLAHQAAIGKVVLSDILHGDEEKYVGWVREAAQRDLNGLYKLLLKVASPAYVAEKASRIFRTYVESGELKIARREQRGGREYQLLQVTGYAPFDTSVLAMRGYIEAPLLLTGAKNLTVRLAKKELRADGYYVEYELSYDL